ncbi:TcdA/TcdB catalytic glycosyltransferase domain-containing protein, partial [Vibrio cholerae]
MRMLSSNDIKTVKRLAFIFNAMLLEEKEEKIALCVKNMPNYLFSEDNLLPLPNHVFFVWIGILKDKYYLDFWCMSKVKPIVYYDSKAYLSGYYLTELKNISIKKDINIIEVQNDFFEYFDRNKSKLNGSFDMSFLQYLEENEIYLRDFYVKKIDQYLSEININNTIEFIDINSIQSLFPDNEFATFYSYEVILRNNLAAASDIIRLLLLKKQGGMYVDLDT